MPDAQDVIADLKIEQARGSFRIALYYEKKKKWDGAVVYYNDVVIKDPNTQYAEQAKLRIDELRIRINKSSTNQPPQSAQ